MSLHSLPLTLTLSSREIATLCEKRHDHVLRDIDAILTSSENNGLEPPSLGAHYTSTTYSSVQGKELREYLCTKKGTLLLVTGYSVEHRLRLINRWEQLEEAAQPKTAGEVLLQMAQAYLEHERRFAALEAEQKVLAERQRITEGKIEDFANGAEHYSITAYHKLFRGESISHSEANKLGRELTRMAKNQGIALGVAPHPIWGTVNTYPKAMMDAWYEVKAEDQPVQ